MKIKKIVEAAVKILKSEGGFAGDLDSALDKMADSLDGGDPQQAQQDSQDQASDAQASDQGTDNDQSAASATDDDQQQATDSDTQDQGTADSDLVMDGDDDTGIYFDIDKELQKIQQQYQPAQPQISPEDIQRQVLQKLDELGKRFSDQKTGMDVDDYGDEEGVPDVNKIVNQITEQVIQKISPVLQKTQQTVYETQIKELKQKYPHADPYLVAGLVTRAAQTVGDRVFQPDVLERIYAAAEKHIVSKAEQIAKSRYLERIKKLQHNQQTAPGSGGTVATGVNPPTTTNRPRSIEEAIDMIFQE